MELCPTQNSYIESLTPNVMVLEIGLWEKTWFKYGHEGRSLIMRSVPLNDTKEQDSFSLFLHAM